MNPVVGVILHAIGGFNAGTFYIPFKKVKNWAWESYWLINGISAWIIVPWVFALLTVPATVEILATSPSASKWWAYFYGVLWGVGGLTFGLSMRYLGMSIGYAITLGFCAAFGTLLPPIYFGTFGGLIATTSGLVTLSGVLVCLVGIGIVGWAGLSKDRELSETEKKASIEEFDLKRGIWVALISGVMSACFAFGLAAGKPIAARAAVLGANSLFVNNPIFILVMGGGITTNLLWCLYLNYKNRTFGNYTHSGDASLAGNYFFSALAGFIWYFQFFFYGMGTTKMGEYDFSSWTIHMAFIIAFSNIWGLVFREWSGASKRTIMYIVIGIAVLVFSTVVVGYGNYLASLGI